MVGEIEVEMIELLTEACSRLEEIEGDERRSLCASGWMDRGETC